MEIANQTIMLSKHLILTNSFIKLLKTRTVRSTAFYVQKF
jgi:hypothetical protein